MSTTINTFRRKQRRTALLLVLVIVGCVVAGQYFKHSQVKQVVTPSSVLLMDDVEVALGRYKDHGEDDKAALVTAASENSVLKVDLLFCGACDVPTAKQLLATLQKSQANARFFFSTIEAGSNREMVSMVLNAGYSVGVLNDGSSPDLVGVAGETVVSNLCRAGVTIQSNYGSQPSSMLMFSQPTEDLLYAARAAYIDTVYYVGDTVRADALLTQEAAKVLIDESHRGSMLCLRLSSFDQSNASGLDWLVQALDETDLNQTTQQMVNASDEEPSDALKLVYTTERASCFTFSALGNDTELDNVLSALKRAGATALFFVTSDEIDSYEKEVRAILDGGHDLGIAVQPGSKSEKDVLEAILLTQEMIKTRFNYTKQLPVRPTTGSASAALRNAVAAGGFTLLSASITPTQQDDMRETDAAVLLEKYFPANRGALRRGEIVHFRMRMYQESDTLLSELVALVARERSAYPLRSIADVMSNTELLYTYPVPEENMLAAVKDKIFPGQLGENSFSEIQKRYYGIDWVASSNFLPGFSKQEIAKLDKKGIISNSQNMVFLTFDDWGTDATITALLDVLKRHNAKATFFVRSNFVSANPNLLRAIALEGHAVGSHTHTHFPLSNVNSTGKVYTELTGAQVEALQTDLVESYRALQSIIGDIEVDGTPALCRIFRPPTLAIGKNGLETVLDCGFTYSVSGYFTSEDYKAKDAASLAKTLKKNTKSGAVLIMHMSDNSIYTADALDIYLGDMELNATADTNYRFTKLTDALKD